MTRNLSVTESAIVFHSRRKGIIEEGEDRLGELTEIRIEPVVCLVAVHGHNVRSTGFRRGA